MQQDGKFQKILAPTDFEGLTAQFAALREELSTLAQSVTATAERRGRRMAADISEGMDEAAQFIERKGQSAEAEITKTFTAHPYLALGLAAGAGLLIGALTRR